MNGFQSSLAFSAQAKALEYSGPPAREKSMKEMKDWYMVFVLIAVLITPLLPQLLKKKCPRCAKRALTSIETNTEEGAPGNPYISFYTCHGCGSQFKQEKSEPLVLLEEELKAPAQAAL